RSRARAEEQGCELSLVPQLGQEHGAKYGGEESEVHLGSSSASRRRSSRSSFHRVVSSRMIAAITRAPVSGSCINATVNAMESVRPSLWAGGAARPARAATV